MSNYDTLETTCCIAGGGPAGVMLGYLLARKGIRVTVLEKHADFFRDFRGDTVHPSSLEVLRELDLLDDLLRLPHQKLPSVGGAIGDFAFRGPDFRLLPTHCKFVAFMPQWDFLNFLSDRAQIFFSTFDLRMQHEVIGLSHDNGRITGVLAYGPGQQRLHVRANLVIGCDGRHSLVRKAAQLPLREFGVPMDVLWFRISRRPDDPQQPLGNFNYGKALILINRSEYYQAAVIVPKGSFEAVRQRGLDAFRRGILQNAPFLEGRLQELQDWSQVQLLTVQLNRLQRWHQPGLLCIGDAAHAMSPVGGVGINLAIQDAVATANLLARPLLEGRVTEADLAAVQKRREPPARITQAVQAFIHEGLAQVFRNPGPIHAPWPLRLALRAPGMRYVLGYAVGLGVRPEHVADAARRPSRSRLSALAAGIGTGLGIAVTLLRKSRAPRHSHSSRLAA